MNDKDIYKLPHLKNISLETLIKETGLYSPILIDTYSDKSRIKSDEKNKLLPISSDVKQLYSLTFIDVPLSLPCAECKRELAFVKTEEVPQHMEIPEINKRASSSPREYFFGSDTLLLNPSTSEEDYITVSKTCKNALLYNLKHFAVRLNCTLVQEHSIVCFFLLPPLNSLRKCMRLI